MTLEFRRGFEALKGGELGVCAVYSKSLRMDRKVISRIINTCGEEDFKAVPFYPHEAVVRHPDEDAFIDLSALARPFAGGLGSIFTHWNIRKDRLAEHRLEQVKRNLDVYLWARQVDSTGTTGLQNDVSFNEILGMLTGLAKKLETKNGQHRITFDIKGPNNRGSHTHAEIPYAKVSSRFLGKIIDDSEKNSVNGKDYIVNSAIL